MTSRDDSEQTSSLLDALRAIHDLKVRQARLEGALRAARTIAHRLNNSLAITVGYCELLASMDGLPDEASEMAREALLGAEAASDSLAKLQELTHLEDGPGSDRLAHDQRNARLEGGSEPTRS